MDDVPSDWRTIGSNSAAIAPNPQATGREQASRLPERVRALALPVVVAAVVASGLGLIGALLVTAATGSVEIAAIERGPGSSGTDGRNASSTSAPLGSAGEPASVAGVFMHEILVDVEGAVRRPGLIRLAPGSRLGDAIEAAGGYAGRADLIAAARLLNLAESLEDGDKIDVPALGEAPVTTPTATAAPAAGPASGALLDLNHADEAALDALPGIGPVTAAKIIAAREATPFTSPDDLQARGVVGQSTMDKIRALVTVLP